MRFGWCTTGHHDSCRKTIGGTREILSCECGCHGAVSPVETDGSTARVWENENGPDRSVDALQPGPNHPSFVINERG